MAYNGQSCTHDARGTLTTKTGNTYTYSGTGYANPDGVTQSGNGLSTTTYACDNNGNLASSALLAIS